MDNVKNAQLVTRYNITAPGRADAQGLAPLHIANRCASCKKEKTVL